MLPSAWYCYVVCNNWNDMRWMYRARTRWYSVMTPTTFDEEYQRQMEALLNYAAARTGLPLIDLR